MYTKTHQATLDISAAGPRTVGRFAPSPTGDLHFGSLVAALASYLSVRVRNGSWHLRIEDLDEQRCHSSFAKSILKTLEVYGFEWDGKVILQSQRKHVYDEKMQWLRSNNLTYLCSCKRKNLVEAVYPGFCRNGPLDLSAATFSTRFKVSSQVVSFEDRRLGACSQDPTLTQGDFQIQRSDGFFSYHFAVVIDDLELGVTEVVRGEDLFSETTKQVCLYKALGANTPIYSHVQLAVDPHGKKLSKQNCAEALNTSNLPTALAQLESAFRHLELSKIPASDFSNPSEYLKAQVNLLSSSKTWPKWLGG